MDLQGMSLIAYVSLSSIVLLSNNGCVYRYLFYVKKNKISLHYWYTYNSVASFIIILHASEQVTAGTYILVYIYHAVLCY